MGSDPYHRASSSDCHHLCRGWNHLHCHTARQIKVGGVTQSVYMITLLGRSRWVRSHRVYTWSHCSADQGGWGHTECTWSHCSAVQGGWGHTDCIGHTARLFKVGGVTQSASTLVQSTDLEKPPECPGLPIVMLQSRA